MKNGKTLDELAREIMAQSTQKKDLLVNTHNLTFETDTSGQRFNVTDEHDNLVMNMGINDIAHRQLGTYLKIPAAYYDRMLSDYPDLLAQNINGWLQQNEPQQRMLRTLGGTMRAFLSERYRMIDNDRVADTVLPLIWEMGADARVESCEITERRMYLKVVNKRLTADVVPGDTVQSGILITNSEVGLGSVNIQPLIYRLVCSNGMVVNDAGTRKYHVGRGNEVDENYEIYTSDTREAEDKAFLMKVEDTVRAAIDETRFEDVVNKFREAKGMPMKKTKIPAVLELTRKTYGLSMDESDSILGHLSDGGDLSLYGLACAVTRASQDVESYDRATEMESIGYNILTMPSSQWKQFNQANLSTRKSTQRELQQAA